MGHQEQIFHFPMKSHTHDTMALLSKSSATYWTVLKMSTEWSYEETSYLSGLALFSWVAKQLRFLQASYLALQPSVETTTGQANGHDGQTENMKHQCKMGTTWVVLLIFYEAIIWGHILLCSKRLKDKHAFQVLQWGREQLSGVQCVTTPSQDKGRGGCYSRKRMLQMEGWPRTPDMTPAFRFKSPASGHYGTGLGLQLV